MLLQFLCTQLRLTSHISLENHIEMFFGYFTLKKCIKF